VPERGEVHGRNKETDVHDQAGKTRGNYSVLEDAYEIYIKYIRDFFNLDLSGIRIAIDCANGAASILAPMVFKQFKADIEVFNSDISGLLINKDCGATHPEFISRATVESRSDLGIAFDGDADRVIICDRRGRIIDGDIIIGFCAIDMAEKKTLANNSIVTTVMANMGLEKVMKENGITVHRTQVGDRYVLEKMAETGSVLGGEQSGHIIFTNISPTGDGILSALEFLNVIVSNNYNFSEITEIIPKYPQILKNIRVADKKRVLESEMLIEAVKKVTNRLNGAGRLLVRPSGTEPLIRVMAEAESEKLAAGAVEEILSVIKEINLEQP
jgi:phosphoglucosamine mutase